MIQLPDGRHFWPLFGLREFGELAPVYQMQLVQTELDALTVRYVCDRPLTLAEEDALRARICASLGYPMRIGFERSLEPLNAGRGYKFEEFKSLLV
jgi:hypothetical protein